MPDSFAYIGLEIIVLMRYQSFNCVYFLSVFVLVYILVFLFSFSKCLVYCFAIKYRHKGNDVVHVYIRIKYPLVGKISNSLIHLIIILYQLPIFIIRS